MNKNFIKAYALRLTKEDVINFGIKEGINVTDSEAALFIDTIKDNIDYILEGNGLEVLESKKEYLSNETYNKLLELFNKYKKFID